MPDNPGGPAEPAAFASMGRVAGDPEPSPATAAAHPDFSPLFVLLRPPGPVPDGRNHLTDAAALASAPTPPSVPREPATQVLHAIDVAGTRYVRAISLPALERWQARRLAHPHRKSRLWPLSPSWKIRTDE